MAIPSRNRGEILVRGRKLDALSGKRKQRLENPLVAVLWQPVTACFAEPLVQKDRRRHAWVVQIWNRKLAQVKVPIRMAGPLHIEVLAVIEVQVNLLLNQ